MIIYLSSVIFLKWKINEKEKKKKKLKTFCAAQKLHEQEALVTML